MTWRLTFVRNVLTSAVAETFKTKPLAEESG